VRPNSPYLLVEELPASSSDLKWSDTLGSFQRDCAFVVRSALASKSPILLSLDA
jgi:hypothetical protein